MLATLAAGLWIWPLKNDHQGLHGVHRMHLRYMWITRQPPGLVGAMPRNLMRVVYGLD